MVAAKKILIVEDEVVLLESLGQYLELVGYIVLTADNGKEGLLRCMSEKPDLILLDIMMPEMDGYQVMQVLQASADLKNIPVIAVSALGREEDIRKAIDLGARDYIVKPYETDDLLSKIKDMLK